MKYDHSLTAPSRTSTDLPLQRVGGTASALRELLHSPASGAACVHWRLRIFETLGGSMELVHEVIAPEPFQIMWRRDPLAPPRPVQLCGERVHIEGQPVLHRPASPGALAVAEHFGLQGRLRVEEVLIHQGESLEAEGLLFDPQAAATGPYRSSDQIPQLYEATVRLPMTGVRLRPALLPWALGTAAALLGAAGTATALAKLWKTDPGGSLLPGSAEIRPLKVRRPRWP
jgi:hypothetical protein